MSKVSCIIPFFNGLQTIFPAINSVLHQELCGEVILVNDGSTQKIHEALQAEYSPEFTTGKLKLIDIHSNHGQGAARNIGASVASSEYLSFLDQDDIYMPDFYSLCVPYMEENGSIGAIEVGIEIYQNNQMAITEMDPRYGTTVRSVPWNILIRKNIFWSCGAFPTGAEFRTEVAGEDIAFKTALKKFYPVVSASNKFIRHFIRDGSATDKFLKRTEVVNGEVVFKKAYQNELDNSFWNAFHQHVNNAEKHLQSELKVKVLIESK